jgi:uncharacterized protein YdeI (YjbR/CyaY-like superfamily)
LGRQCIGVVLPEGWCAGAVAGENPTGVPRGAERRFAVTTDVRIGLLAGAALALSSLPEFEYMPMSTPTFFANALAFRRWLAAHADSAAELLVGFHKVGSGMPCMSWSESVDEALCVGWIDGVRRRIDDATYSIRFTPRKPQSIWSAVNIAKFAQLEAEGRMQPAGARAFALRSEARSRVYAYEREDGAELSTLELAAFQSDAVAWAFFERAPPSYRKVVLHWITTAKKPETRAARLTKLVEASSAGQRLR